MHDQVVELAERGKALAPVDRSRLVDMLLESLNEQTLNEIESAWDEEVEQRLAAHDRGDVQAIDGEESLGQSESAGPAMNFRFLPAAQAELLEGISHYAAIRPELGERFERAVALAVRSAVAHPDRGAPRSKNTRRWLVKGFPFGVIYRASDEMVVIVGCSPSEKTAGVTGANVPGNAIRGLSANNRCRQPRPQRRWKIVGPCLR